MATQVSAKRHRIDWASNSSSSSQSSIRNYLSHSSDVVGSIFTFCTGEDLLCRISVVCRRFKQLISTRPEVLKAILESFAQREVREGRGKFCFSNEHLYPLSEKVNLSDESKLALQRVQDIQARLLQKFSVVESTQKLQFLQNLNKKALMIELVKDLTLSTKQYESDELNNLSIEEIFYLLWSFSMAAVSKKELFINAASALRQRNLCVLSAKNLALMADAFACVEDLQMSPFLVMSFFPHITKALRRKDLSVLSTKDLVLPTEVFAGKVLFDFEFFPVIANMLKKRDLSVLSAKDLVNLALAFTYANKHLVPPYLIPELFGLTAKALKEKDLSVLSANDLVRLLQAFRSCNIRDNELFLHVRNILDRKDLSVLSEEEHSNLKSFYCLV